MSLEEAGSSLTKAKKKLKTRELRMKSFSNLSAHIDSKHIKLRLSDEPIVIDDDSLYEIESLDAIKSNILLVL